jgi:hypothetical protein
MDDPQIHGTIEQLVTEEHELWEREAAGKGSDADRRRLEELKGSDPFTGRLHRDHSRRISSVMSISSLLVRRTHESEIPDEEEASR